MGRRWISPFDLYESPIWRNRQLDNSGNPDDNDKNDTRLVRDAVGNGSGNPLFCATETSIRDRLNPEFEEKIQGLEDMEESG